MSVPSDPPGEGAYRVRPTYLAGACSGGPLGGGGDRPPDPDGPARGLASASRVAADRLAITGLLIEVLQQIFRRAADFEDQRIRDYRWDPDEAQSQVRIVSSGTLDLETIDRQPAIVVAPGDWANRPLGIGHNRAFGGGSFPRYVASDGGTHAVFAAAITQDAAEALGAHVYKWLRALQPVISRMLPPGSRFLVRSLGAPGRLEEARRVHAVPVSLAYDLASAHRLTTDAPLLQAIALSLETP